MGTFPRPILLASSRLRPPIQTSEPARWLALWQNRTYGCLSLALYYINWCWLSLIHIITLAYHILLFQTMFLVAFYGFFRVGELTTKTTKRRRSVLQFQFLSFLKPRSEVPAAKLVTSDYKHNTTGPGFLFPLIIIHRDSTVQFCPVEFLLRWSHVRRSNSGSLFFSADGSAVKTERRSLRDSSKEPLLFVTVPFTNRSLYALVQLGWQLKTACLTRRFAVLVVGNPMHLSYTYDRQPRWQIRFVFSVIAVMGW